MNHVIYHKNCADGFMSAFLLWKALPPGSQFYEAQYGDPLPSVDFGTEDRVLVVDFSYPATVLNELASRVREVVVLDHHKTAEAALQSATLAGNISLTFDMTKCGARLTREWIWSQNLGNHLYVTLVGYVEDRDLWKWELLDSREVSAAIASYPKEFGVWDKFDIVDLGREGRAILRYQKQLVEQIVRSASFVGGVARVNCGVLQSEVGEALSSRASYAEMWVMDENKGKEIHSLRSKSPDGADVSVIAARFGGGGHKHAAGYSIEAVK